MTIALPAGALTMAVRTALDEDLGAAGDPTSRLLGARAAATGMRTSGRFCGPMVASCRQPRMTLYWLMSS